MLTLAMSSPAPSSSSLSSFFHLLKSTWHKYHALKQNKVLKIWMFDLIRDEVGKYDISLIFSIYLYSSRDCKHCPAQDANGSNGWWFKWWSAIFYPAPYLIFTRDQGRNIPCVALSSGGLWGAQCPCPPSRHGRPLTSRTGMLKLWG